ncbi:MAG: hybrid sensor histidine kinase/response regulator [Candidatus Omnitrophica bacterium]|nr:hybrid sensor histidine kinase/response regulator [Candidatus Omnitrophota bacterium]
MSKKDEFIALFKAEAEDYVTALNQGLLDLEKAPDNMEIAKELNRVAHTLKGAARVFKFNDIQDITHHIEDIFERIYHKQMAFSSPLADKVFKALDIVKGILEHVGKGEPVLVDVTEICHALKEALPADANTAPLAQTISEPAAQPSAVKAPEVLAAVSKPVAAPEKNKPESDQPQADADEFIRVPLSRVNKLLNLVGEIVINKMKTSAKISQAKKLGALSKDIQLSLTVLGEAIKAVAPEDESLVKILGRCHADIQKLKEGALLLWDNLSDETFHLDPVIDDLQASMKELRMLPVSTIFESFPRMIRDIAQQKGREIVFEISGEKTELDKKVLEGLKSPLMHILRNSIDHGIEDPAERAAAGKPKAGKIHLSAFHEAGAVVIRIEDDGQGLDPERIRAAVIKKGLIPEDELAAMSEQEVINCIFMNGFSTSKIITDISGRGIGLDIVRRSIESLKGRIIIESEKGKGTTFTLVLPLTIAIIQVLLIRVQGHLFALPVTAITESLEVDMDDVATMEGRLAVQVRGNTLPLVRLSDVLGLPAIHEDEDEDEDGRSGKNKKLPVVVVSSLEKRIGFIVDRIIGDEEVFVKGLGNHLGKVRNVIGATILWTGDVAVILDVEDLTVNTRLSHPAVQPRKAGSLKRSKDKRVLVCDDAMATRELLKSLIQAVGYTVDTAVDGRDGMEKLSMQQYDLVVSDVEMPRMSGFELCSIIRKTDEYKDIPLILVTALEKEEHKRHGIEVGASAYIVKTSFDQSTLMDTIERLLG